MVSFFKHNRLSMAAFVIILIAQLNSYYIIWAFFLLLSAAYLIKSKGVILKPKLPSLFPWALIIVIGMLQGYIYNYNSGVKDYFRDIVYTSTFILFWYIVWDFCNKLDAKTVIATIYTACWVIGIIETTIRIVRFISVGGGFSSFVSEGQVNHYIIAIGLFLGFFRPDGMNKYYCSSGLDKFAKISMIITFMLSFSRSALVVFLILLGVTSWRRFASTLKIIILVLVGVLILGVVLPDIYNTFVDKIARSLVELAGGNINWSDSTNIVMNWRAYEVYCAKLQFGEYSTIQKILGHGFGTLVDAKGYAYLVTGGEGLAVLHNGYYTTLIKTGYLGVVCYIAGLLSLLLYSLFNMKGYTKKLALGLIISETVITTAVNGSLFAGSSVVFFFLIAYCVRFGKVDIDENYCGNSNI